MKIHCLDHPGSTTNTFLCKVNQHTIVINCPLETLTLSSPPDHEENNTVIPPNDDLMSILASFSMQGKQIVDAHHSLEQKQLDNCDHLTVFRVPDFSLVDLDSIDLVLIANSQCMLGLPYLTEYMGYKGRIIATEPTIEYAKQRMEELVIYHGQSTSQIEPSRSTHFSQLNNMFESAMSEGWRSIYTQKDVLSCIEKIQPVRYTEQLSLFSTLDVVPYSSGYSLGSCNWLLKTSFKRIVFLSHSSLYANLHPAPLDHAILKGADAIIVGGLTQPSEKDSSFERAKSRFLVQVARTIQSLHNAVVVTPASGLVFDLIGDLENYFRSLGLEIGHEKHQVPIYVASPIADRSLKYANICGEWMNSGRHDLLYMPQMPLTHGELMRTGAVEPITSLEASILSEHTMREPCIVFTGDSTCLQKGYLSWFLQHWEHSELNTCLCIDPDSPAQLQEKIPAHGKINVIRLPLDTRLKLEDIPSILQMYWHEENEQKDRHLIIPKIKGSGLIQQQILGSTQVIVYQPGQMIEVDLSRDWEPVSVSERLAKTISPKRLVVEDDTESARSTVWASIHGTLNYYNNRLEIHPSMDVKDDLLLLSSRDIPMKTELTHLIQQFEKHAIPLDITRENETITLYLPKDMNAKIVIKDSMTMIYANDDQTRAFIRHIVTKED